MSARPPGPHRNLRKFGYYQASIQYHDQLLDWRVWRYPGVSQRPMKREIWSLRYPKLQEIDLERLEQELAEWIENFGARKPTEIRSSEQSLRRKAFNVRELFCS